MFPQDNASRGSSEIDVCEPYSAPSTSSGSGSYDKYSGLKPINHNASSSSLRSFGQQSHTSSFHGEMAGFAIIEVKDFDELGKVADTEELKNIDLKDSKDQVDSKGKEAPPPATLDKIKKKFKMTPCAWASAGMILLAVLVAGVAVVATMGTVKRSSATKAVTSPSPPVMMPSPVAFKSPKFQRSASYVRLASPSNGYFPDPSFNISGPIDWYKSHWDDTAMTARSVSTFFAALAKYAKKTDLAAKLPVTNATMLLYMRAAEPQFPMAIQAFRTFLMNGNNLPADSIPATALATVVKEAGAMLDAAGPMKWMQSLYEADAARQNLMEASYQSNITAAVQAVVKNVTATFSSTPYTPAPLEARITTALKAVSDGGTGSTLRPPGFRSFNFLTIPVVVHSLMYVEGTNTLQPASAYWSTQPFGQLIDKLNAMFDSSYTRIRFKLQEARTDPVLYPYLLAGTYEDWQKCASQGPDCITLMASDNNVDPTTTINIWTAGTLARRTEAKSCANCTLGYAWQPPYQFSSDASAAAQGSGFSNTEAFRSQHVYLNWDVIDSDMLNSEQLWDMGASVAARYVARHLGLANVLPACDAKAASRRTSMGTAATDPSKWFATADAWCSKAQKANGNPDLKSLPDAAPCGKSSLDAMFDIMNPVTPPACALFFSPESIFTLQALVYRERPIMYSQQSGGTTTP